MRDVAHERDEALLEVQELKERVRELEVGIKVSMRLFMSDEAGDFIPAMDNLSKLVGLTPLCDAARPCRVSDLIPEDDTPATKED